MIYNIDNDGERIENDSMKLKVDAYNWYMWWKNLSTVTSWSTFKNDLFKRFHEIKKGRLFYITLFSTT